MNRFQKVLRAVAVFCTLTLFATAVRSQVVINEFAYDDSQTDDEEYVELFNAGDTEVDLEGWFLATGLRPPVPVLRWRRPAVHEGWRHERRRQPEPRGRGATPQSPLQRGRESFTAVSELRERSDG